MDETVKALCASLLSQPIFLTICIIGLIGAIYSILKNIVTIGKNAIIIGVLVILCLIVTPLASKINVENVYTFMIGITAIVVVIVGILFLLITMKSNKVKDDKNSQKDKIVNLDDLDMKCPKCGGELKYKDGKYGAFFGCSNYPTCKYTKK